MYDVEGKACLDLFAGSGALGLEALSRGAKQVTFVEKSRQAAQQIKTHLNSLNCAKGKVCNDDAIRWLEQSKASKTIEGFDILFLDPPFHKEFLHQVLETIINDGYINPNGYIYIEAESSYQLPKLPEGWQLNRKKTAKNKVFFLLKNSPQS